MFMDYTKYLLSNKKKEAIKINQRIVDILKILIRQGEIESSDFLSLPEIKALLSPVSRATRSRDFKKMLELRLVKYTEKNEKLFIEPNFQILEQLRYNVWWLGLVIKNKIDVY